MDDWWNCDALDKMCCRAIRAGLDKRFAFRLPNALALLTALLVNQQRMSTLHVEHRAFPRHSFV
jgi:hypothetical protein